MGSVYEAAGGDAGLRSLASAWHARVLADEVVSHAFSHGVRPDHTERLAAYWAEALGGPPRYSELYGDETSAVRLHSGNGPHDEMDARAIACFDQALVDVGFDGDERLRAVLHDYFAWTTTTTMGRYHESADDVPDDLPMPHWSWEGLVREVPRTFREGPSEPIRLADQPGTWVEVDIAAPSERVWALVTDIELPARYSEEFLGATWRTSDRGLGASFIGRNRHPAIGEWEVESFVEVYEELRSFGWATVDLSAPGARWRFDLEPSERGTRLRFSMSIGPGPSGVSSAIDAMPDKEPRILHRRVGEHHANMARTVEGIRRLAEGGA